MSVNKGLRKRLPKRVEIIGTRWFQKSYGNTYHVARVYFDDELVYESPITYGYDDGYVQTAQKWLAENRWMPSDEVPWRYFRDQKGRQYQAHAVDVPRERDLGGAK